MKPSPPRQLRTDIQFLRGFAVLVVVLYHAKIPLFAGGYLGVDVFFVISGFLITSLIRKGIDNGSFTFSGFYYRRAKRLLPAAYVTFLVTAILAPFFLTHAELEDLRMQMVGAITFTANIVLWQQSGYFFGAAELKPLLHVWSLSIEEQYYFIFPAMMFFVPRRYWLWMTTLVLVASLALCWWRIGQESTFYLLPTRAWELMIGSVGALLAVGQRLEQALKLLFWPALVLLLALPLVKFGYHPGPQAVLICLATIIVILRRPPVLSKGLGVHALSRVGDISYSLYLVHWPIFAFFNNLWFSENGAAYPIGIMLGLIALSFLLAYLLNRYVEEPIHRAKIKGTRPMLGATLATSISLSLLPVGMLHAFPADKNYAEIRRVPHGLDQACNFEQDFSPIPECRNAQNPDMLVWGDSFAMHLVPGLLGADGGAPAMVQATRSTCAPLLGVAVLQEDGWLNKDWAINCIDFNESVIRYLETADSVKTVVVSSPFVNYLDKRLNRLLERDAADGSYRVVDPGPAVAAAGLKRTVDRVRALGKRVVVIGPPPTGGFDTGRCLERFESGLPVLGVARGCAISRAALRAEQGQVLDFLALVSQEAGVGVIRFDDYLCDDAVCRTDIDGTFLYSDGGHLSHQGSVMLTNSMSILEKIQRLAQ